MLSSYKGILTKNNKWFCTVNATTAKAAYRQICKLYPHLKGWYVEKYTQGKRRVNVKLYPTQSDRMDIRNTNSNQIQT